MSKQETVQDYIRRITSLGGKARAANLTKKRRSEIAALGGKAAQQKRLAKKARSV